MILTIVIHGKRQIRSRNCFCINTIWWIQSVRTIIADIIFKVSLINFKRQSSLNEKWVRKTNSWENMIPLNFCPSRILINFHKNTLRGLKILPFPVISTQPNPWENFTQKLYQQSTYITITVFHTKVFSICRWKQQRVKQNLWQFSHLFEFILWADKIMESDSNSNARLKGYLFKVLLKCQTIQNFSGFSL